MQYARAYCYLRGGVYEQMQWLQINLWELLHQLEYVEPHQRVIVYEEIQHIRAEIQRVVDQLIAHDRAQHPLP